MFDFLLSQDLLAGSFFVFGALDRRFVPVLLLFFEVGQMHLTGHCFIVDISLKILGFFVQPGFYLILLLNAQFKFLDVLLLRIEFLLLTEVFIRTPDLINVA